MSEKATRIVRVVTFALSGAIVALTVGLVAVVLAPDDGFGDLAAAALTTVFLIPAGLVTGSVAGWWTGRKPTEQMEMVQPPI